MNLQEEVQKRFQKYRESFKDGYYEPFRLTFWLSSPICLTHPWICLDAILSHQVFKKALGDFYYLLPCKYPIGGEGSLRLLPLMYYKNKIPCASASIFQISEMKSETVYKRFEDRYLPKTQKKKIYRGSGFYKDFAMRMIYLLSDKVSFYGKGDINQVSELIEDLQGLGNDTRIGWGAIRNFEIEKTKEDYSIIKDGICMRPIPIEFIEEADDTEYVAWRSPYWAKDSIELCAIPGAKIKLK